jgi:threonine synthase
MSEQLRAPVIPEFEWRLRSAACRGLFIAENIVRHGAAFDWLAQSVCAGYGPLGIYRAFSDLVDSGALGGGAVPRFLAVQQGGLCPISAAWQTGQERLPPLKGTDWQEAPIEPALYNVYPDATYPDLFRTLKAWGGDAVAVHTGEFERLAPEFLERLEAARVELTRVGGEMLECAGVLAGAGVLKAIGDGRIAPGSTVLCALTGGAGEPPAQRAVPEAHIKTDDDLGEAIADLVDAYAD